MPVNVIALNEYATLKEGDRTHRVRVLAIGKKKALVEFDNGLELARELADLYPTKEAVK